MYKKFNSHILRIIINALMTASLLAGLIPPPLVRTLLPDPAAELVEAVFPAAEPVEAAPLAQLTGSNVLTVTKTLVGTGSGPFNITVTGSNGYNNATTVSPGTPTVLSGLASGVYTVTESSPGAGWTTSYNVTSGTGTANANQAVVTLQNANSVTPVTAAAISGQVYNDYNSDGQITANGTVTDTGVSGVTVSFFGPSGHSCGSTTTTTNGSYSATPSCTGPWRVTFSNLPSGYEPTTHSTGNGTSTQFVSSAPVTNVNLGLLDPCDYCQNSPTLATSELRNGDPLAAGNNLSTLPALVSWPYSYGSSSPAPTTRATLGQTGAVWGLAYQRETQKLFSAAVVRRHAGLGPNGLGAIYQTDLNNGVTSLLVDVSASLAVNIGTIASNSARGLPSNRTQPNQDATAFSSLGKVGIGDLDLSNDGKTLFFTNLFERNVNGLNIGNPATTPTTATRYDLPTTNCTNGVARPWALKSYRDTLYVGVVCTAESAGGVASNLAAYIYAMDLTVASPAFASTPVLTTPLTYPKGCVEAGIVPIVPNCQWNPWTDDFASLGHDVNNQYTHPQPIFSDIEFDVDGSLILAFTDRTAMQLGDANYPPTATSPLIRGEIGGDLLRAYPSGTNQWTLESGGDKDGPGPFTPTASNLTVRNRPTGPGGQGPGNGEFYYDETFSSHEETGMGALAFLPGSQHIAATTMNPVTFFQNGIRKFSNNSGGMVGAYPILTGLGPSTFGKAAGLGDLELLCDPAPIEIGNRVWDDLDGDGEQDAGEPGLPNLTVSLQGPTNTVTVNTDPDGLYYFNNLTPYTAYTLTMDVPAGYNLTAANQIALSGSSVQSNDAISDTIDSDAVLVGGVATIYYSTGGAGQNNHGLDFGFTQPVTGQVDILNTAPPESGTIQIVKNTIGGNGSFGYTSSNATLDDVHLTTVGGAASSGVMTFSPGSYTIAEDSLVGWSLTGLSCTGDGDGGNVIDQASRQVTIDLDDGEDIVCTFTNTAQSSSVTPSNVLTVTKTISGAGSGPFDIEIEGPNGYLTNTQIDDGDVLTFDNLASGIYTVTETSPGAGWTTIYTATTGYSTGSSAVVTMTNPITATSFGPSQITGRVFNDYNADGNITANGVVTDTGVQSVTVTIYDNLGNSVSTVSGATGYYTITPSFAGPYRAVFTNLPDGYEPSRVYTGTQNGTSVQFVNADTVAARTLNFGVLNPADYLQATPPLLATTVYRNGDASDASNSTNTAVASWPYYQAGTGGTQYQDATINNVGALWGLAWQRSTKLMFASAFLKRHVGLGPRGADGIYILNYTSNPATLVGGFDLQGVTPANGGAAIDLGTVNRSGGADFTLGATTAPSYDLDAYDKVGKMGFGDIDLSDDGRTLWAVNLRQVALIQIDVSNVTPNVANPAAPPGTVNQYLLSTLPGTPSCTNGTFRPFALELRGSAGYLGGVCDAATSPVTMTADLRAYVVSFNPSNVAAGFSPVINFPLNYTREVNNAATTHRSFDDARWHAWLATWPVPPLSLTEGRQEYAQPILSDIEFTDNGSMVLGLSDRFAHQTGHDNYLPISGNTAIFSSNADGDIIQACNVNGSFVLEGQSGCPTNDQGPAQTALAVSNDGPSNTGEFYWQDYFYAGAFHPETTLGGLLRKPGSGEIVSTEFDPIGLFTQGTQAFNTTTGAAVRSYEVVGDFSSSTFGKGAGLGDLELLLDPAPIEIGNRVWWDMDGDGEQDAGEPGLPSLTVSLQGPTSTVTTNTDGNGLYYFGNLKTYTAYTLTLSVPSGYSLSAANQAALSGASVSSNHAISDVIDSDAALIGGVATIYYSTGSAGQNNHGLDFGFTQPATGQVDILNSAPSLPSLALDKELVSPANGVAVEGETVIFSLTISNTGAVSVTELNLSDSFDASYLQFSSASIAPDTTGAGSLTWVGDSVAATGSLLGQLPLAPGDSFAITVEFVAVKP